MVIVRELLLGCTSDYKLTRIIGKMPLQLFCSVFSPFSLSLFPRFCLQIADRLHQDLGTFTFCPYESGCDVQMIKCFNRSADAERKEMGKWKIGFSVVTPKNAAINSRAVSVAKRRFCAFRREIVSWLNFPAIRAWRFFNFVAMLCGGCRKRW